MKKLLFIVNPRAGKTKSSAPLFDAVAALSRAGYLVRVFVTEAGGDARRVAAEWGPDYDTVVCAGGDGTLNETISGLMTLPQRPLLGYLPNGSTNDFAASLHLSSDPRLAALDIAGGSPHPLDIGRHNDRYFAYVASFGFKGSDQQKLVGVLSGGERNRLNLALTLKQGGNLLLLDEPTNDLDVETLESLENALLAFPGCAVVISHDRWFLDRVATHILAWEGTDENPANWYWFEGNFQAYQENRIARLGEDAARPHRLHRKLTR